MIITHKKIIFVYDAIYPFVKGGGEKRYFEIGKLLAKDGYDVHLFGMKYWQGSDIIELNGMKLHGMCKARSLYTKSGRRSMVQAVWFGLVCFKLFRESFDVLDCCNFPYFSLFTCRIVTWVKRKKLYSTWHEVWGKEYWNKYLGRLGFVGRVVEKVAVGLPDVIISVSEKTTKALRGSLGRRKKILTIQNAVDVGLIKKTTPSNLNSDVIFVGRLLVYKNINVLIKAIAVVKKTVPEIMCLIVGGGPEKNNLLNLIKDLKIDKNVKMVGAIENDEEVYSLMKASKMLVLPSEREGFGLVVIEGFAAGLPVLTSLHENNAAKDLIIPGVNGFLVRIEEMDIAEKISMILNKKNLFTTEVGLKSFDWKVAVKKYQAEITKI